MWLIKRNVYLTFQGDIKSAVYINDLLTFTNVTHFILKTKLVIWN